MQPKLRTQNRTENGLGELDSAAVLGAVLSLYRVCMAQARREGLKLTEAYQGVDQFMREIMRVGHVFEEWASAHVDFEHFDEVWPYFLHDNFGSACVSVVSPLDLASFAAEDCLRIALRMNIPLRIDSDLPVPLFAECQNPVVGSGFRFLRIQRVPKPSDGISACADTSADEPFAASHGQPYCSLYGVYDDGQLEHIASRQTYSETLALANALAPGADFVASYAHRQRAMPRCKSGSDQRAKKRFR